MNLISDSASGIRAWFSAAETDFSLPENGDVFSGDQTRVLSGIGIDTGRVVNIRQVHGADVIRVSARDAGRRSEDLPLADGMVTADPGVVLAVRTADCVPVVLGDPVARCAGLVHAGWRSTRGGIAASAVVMMTREFGSCPENIRAVIGPSIRSCCYQVSQDFCEIFPEEMEPRRGNWFLNLQAACRRQLTASGLRPRHIVEHGQCTFCADGFFSYRRQGPGVGRHVSLVTLC